MAEDKEGKKDHQDHAEKVVGQQISNHFHGLEVLQDPERQAEHESPESQPHQNHDESFLFPFSCGVGKTVPETPVFSD